MSRLKVQMVNNLPAVQETQVKSLGCGNPLDLEMASHSSIPAWRTPWTEEPGGLQARVSQRVGHDWENWATNTQACLVDLETRISNSKGSHGFKWVLPENNVWTVPISMSSLFTVSSTPPMCWASSLVREAHKWWSPGPCSGQYGASLNFIHWITTRSGSFKGLPGGTSGKESACQCRRRTWWGLDPWVRKIPWRRDWQLTTVFLPGESHGQRSLADYSPWGQKESDMTEETAHR